MNWISTRQYLIMLIISLIVSLYLFEGYLTFTKQYSKNQLQKEKLYEKKNNNKWETRSHLEIYSDFKKINKEVTISIAPKDYLFEEYSIFPMGGISNTKTIFCNENGYYSIYQSDRYGFNNPNTEWDKKEIEYLLIGDSFTHGACVNRPYDMGSVLRKLSNKSVLNLGQRGNGPLIEYVTLREYLNTSIKKILWVYYEGNDLEDLKNEKNEIILKKYLNDLNYSQNLKSKQNKIDKIAKKIIEDEILSKNKKKTKNKVLKFLRLDKTKKNIFRNSLKENKPDTKILNEFKKILELSKDLATINNSRLYFIYLPTYSRYVSKYNDYNYNPIKKIVNELDIPFIDMDKEVFKKEENPLKFFPFEMFGHYNEDGYKKVTEIIYQHTKD